MRFVSLALLACTITATAAPRQDRRELRDYLPAAPLYAVVRIEPLARTLRQLGVAEAPAFKALQGQLGGVDLLNPLPLRLIGLRLDTPVAVAAGLPLGNGRTYARLVAALDDPRLVGQLLDTMTDQSAPLHRVEASTALGQLGVRAVAQVGSQTLVIRIDGQLLVVDGESASGRAAAPLDVVRRHPLRLRTTDSIGLRAQHLLDSAAALTLYLDGEQLPLFSRALRGLLTTLAPSYVTGSSSEQDCQRAWSVRSPTFDELTVTVDSDPTPTLVATWNGAQFEPPPLDTQWTDPGGLDAAALAAHAPLTGTIYPNGFELLFNRRPHREFRSIRESLTQCPIEGGPEMLVRSWPEVLSSALEVIATASPLASQLVSSLRKWVIAVRSLEPYPAAPQVAIGLALDGAHRAELVKKLKLLLAPKTSRRTLAGHPTTVYHLGFAELLGTMTPLGADGLWVTLATGEKTLRWIFSNLSAPPHPTSSLAEVHLDLPVAARLAHICTSCPLGAWLTRLRRLDAELTLDSHEVRLRLSVPGAQRSP